MKYFWIILALIVLAGVIYFISRSNYGTMTKVNPTSTPIPEETVVGSNVSISIQNFAFSPPSITVPALTEVTFTNNDSTAHTITADDGSFNSGSIEPGKQYLHTFEKPGTFKYHCSIHPTMKGEVTVE